MATSSFAYGSGLSWFDPASGAVKHVSAYYYRAGTLDPITVYTTSDLSIPFPVPVIATGYGKLPPVWIAPQTDPGYRVRVFDQFSTLVEDVDNIPTPTTAGSGGGGGGTINPGDPRLYATGDVVMSFSNAQPRLGFVLCNGGSIGPTGSTNVVEGGRANDDTNALFLWLWGQDIYGLLAVLPSRGTTAAGDWTAKKAIRTPDLMGRSIVGMDTMGAGALTKNRLAGITFAAGTQAQVGSYGGAAPVKTLAITEMPAHNHPLTDPTHQHYAVTPDHLHYDTVGIASDSAHQHYVSGVTDTEAAHTHVYSQITSGPSGYGAGGPAYTNNANTSAAGAHNHSINFWTRSGDGAHAHTAYHYAAAADRSLAHWTDLRATGITIQASGGGAAWQLMAPFYALCFHIKL